MNKIRIPPNDKATEEVLLWSLLIDNSIVEEFFVNWQLEWFYNYPEIAEAVFYLAINNKDIDLVSVKTQLETNWTLAKIGWLSTLVELTEAVVSTSYWGTHSKKLEELYKKRELIKVWTALINWVDWDDYAEKAEKATFNINKILSEWESQVTSTEDNITLLEEYINQNKNKWIIWYSWWNEWLDKYTLWIRKGKTYRIWAPSWVWKTNLLYWTVKSLLEGWAKVLVVSLENDIATTYAKFLSTVQGVNNRDIELGKIKADTDYLRKYKNQLFLTDQLFDLDVIFREIKKVKPDVIFLDYIWLVNIKWVDDEKIFNIYAKRVKEFVQKNNYLAWIDLSNLNTWEGEDEIRKYKKFNGSASLRNNTDFWLWLFHYKPFYTFRTEANKIWESEKLKDLEKLAVVTFFIGKNRLWPDPAEKQFWINFDKGIVYEEIPKAKLDSWDSY